MQRGRDTQRGRRRGGRTGGTGRQAPRPRHGTAVAWYPDAAEAWRLAKAQQRLLLVMHLSGDLAERTRLWNNAQAFQGGALSDPEVGKLYNASFICTYQKVGTFLVIQTEGDRGRIKVGGNVATYFCTPDRQVLHAVAGPVAAAVLLREATWALQVHARLQAESHVERQREIVAAAHRAPPALVPGERAVHDYLAHHPLRPLAEVARYIWQVVLGEQFSDAPVQLLDLAQREPAAHAVGGLSASGHSARRRHDAKALGGGKNPDPPRRPPAGAARLPQLISPEEVVPLMGRQAA